MFIVSVMTMVISIWLCVYISLQHRIIFSFPLWLSSTDFNCLCTVICNIRLQNLTQYICIVLWAQRTASEQTYWVVMDVVVVCYLSCPGFSGILLACQNTSTRMNTDSRTGRAVHSGKCWVEWWGGNKEAYRFPISADIRCRLFHVVHVDRGLMRSFIVAVLFLSLAGLLSRGSCHWYDFCCVRSSKLQHICVFSHQCEIVQYDGRLMLKQDQY